MSPKIAIAMLLFILWAALLGAPEKRLYTIDELLAPAIEKAKWGQDI